MARFKFTYNGKEIWIDNYLRYQLDSCIYNLKFNAKGDWDIMIIITGDRMVRTGKSTFAQLIGAYFSYRLGIPYNINDIFFDSDYMIDKAMKKGKFGINHYDEARRGLATSKRFKKVQEDILDYYTECGQLNQINLIILPDFFSLNEDIAVARSELLINVYRGVKKKFVDLYNEGEKIPITEWDRGFFSFFSRAKKAKLYDCFLKTRQKNYFATKADFNGNFEDFGIIEPEQYREYKFNELKKYQKVKKVNRQLERWKHERDILMYNMNKEGHTGVEIAEMLELDKDTVNLAIRNIKKELGVENEEEKENSLLLTPLIEN